MFLDLLRELHRMLPRRHDNTYLNLYGNWYQRRGWDKGQHWYDDPDERWLYFKSNSRMMLRKIWPYPHDSISGEEVPLLTDKEGKTPAYWAMIRRHGSYNRG